MNELASPLAPSAPGERKKVSIYTDGACTGNPGPGGYAVILEYGEKRRELSGGFRKTTNNRMELMAAITGLQSLRYPCDVTLYSDSQYLINGISKGWAKKWRANGWRTASKQPAVNVDLWTELLALCETHKVTFVWVKGHDGHDENERCDALAVKAAAGKDLPADEEYERSR
ncbi:MAG: ribonuclease HI [Capsulimonadaceae bacterium]|nr:ribonuclease HI [Capsulimonadaceae bacterium]